MAGSVKKYNPILVEMAEPCAIENLTRVLTLLQVDKLKDVFARLVPADQQTIVVHAAQVIT